LSILIVTVPALALSALFEKPRPPLSVALIASALLAPALAPLPPLDGAVEVAPAAAEPDVPEPPEDVELLSFDPPPHAASTALTTTSVTANAPQRRILEIATAIRDSSSDRVRFTGRRSARILPAASLLVAMASGNDSLNAVAFSATVHCLTGCVIGEVLGMAIGTAAGFSNLATVALSIALAFLFGYSLTSLPLLRSGLALSAVVPLALASDTISIAIMELVDNALMLAIPGAMDAGLGQLRFWGSLALSLLIAGAAAYPANRWLIARGRGHAVVHAQHGGGASASA
jgi:hypothetical protein